MVDIVDPVRETAEVNCTDDHDVESSLLEASLPETDLLGETEVPLLHEKDVGDVAPADVAMGSDIIGVLELKDRSMLGRLETVGVEELLNERDV